MQAQSVTQRLSTAVAEMEADASQRHSIIACMVVDRKTGRVVYEHLAQTGLAAASTQKIFTSCAGFDLLGHDYHFSTRFAYQQSGEQTTLLIHPSGDPSFGSFRFATTRPSVIIKGLVNAFQQLKIKRPISLVQLVDSGFISNEVPGGWIWEDIGNYYGAPARSFNWRENQYDISLHSGDKPGEKVQLETTDPVITDSLTNEVLAAEKGTGDRTSVYLPYGKSVSLIEGTIPVNEKKFIVSATLTDPLGTFVREWQQSFSRFSPTAMFTAASVHTSEAIIAGPETVFFQHQSPPYDSLNFWFLKRSINLYGEAFIKAMAITKTGKASTQAGAALVRDFWADHGIERSALHIADGSGLSPQNRVTADALVKALLYAGTRPWFNSFYYDLPEYNGMKMKSGSINGARAFAGYHTARDGNNYCFAIIVNNYDGAAGDTVKKMFKVLDNLK